MIPPWAEEFAKKLKDLVFIRQKDMVLIIPPNQVFSMNATGFRLLSFLMKGGSLEEVARAGGERALKDALDFLRDLKALVEGDFKEDGAFATDFVPYRKNFYTYPVLSEFSVTWRCNLDCRFCYRTWKESPELTTRQAQEVIRIIKEDAEVPFVSFTGGEPLLREDLFALIKFARSIGLKVNLISNATLVTERVARKLREAGLGSAQVSLESPSAEVHDALTGVVGSWKATVEGIKNLMGQGIYLHTNTTINAENAESMLDYPRFLRSLGLRKFSANLIIPVGEGMKHRELWMSYSRVGYYLEKLKKRAEEEGVEFVWYSPLPYCIYNPVARGLGAKSCAACHGLLAVDPQGFLLPCSSYPERIGNLLEEGFEKLWFSPGALYFRNMEYLPRPCRSCHLKQACGGACPLYWRARGAEEIENKPGKEKSVEF